MSLSPVATGAASTPALDLERRYGLARYGGHGVTWLAASIAASWVLVAPPQQQEREQHEPFEVIHVRVRECRENGVERLSSGRERNDRVRRRARPPRPAALVQRRGRRRRRSCRAEASEEASARSPFGARAPPLHRVALLAGGRPNVASRPIHPRTRSAGREPVQKEELSPTVRLTSDANASTTHQAYGVLTRHRQAAPRRLHLCTRRP
jgi:hypothetical protein